MGQNVDGRDMLLLSNKPVEQEDALGAEVLSAGTTETSL